MDGLGGKSAVSGASDDRKGVPEIEGSHHGDLIGHALHRELGTGGAKLDLVGSHPISGFEAEARDRAMVDLEEGLEILIVAVGQQHAIARDEIDEALERELDGGQIGKDIGVVEFEVVDDANLGEVVSEFASFVEERRIVFIPLENDPRAIGETGSTSEISGDAADQEAGIQASGFENPSHQGGGGGLTVSSGDDDRTFSADKVVLDELRKRPVGKLLLKDMLDFRIASGKGIADHHQIGVMGEIGCLVGGLNRDALRLEKRGHRGISALVGTGHLISLLFECGGTRRHRRAADSAKVDGLNVLNHGQVRDLARLRTGVKAALL